MPDSRPNDQGRFEESSRRPSLRRREVVIGAGAALAGLATFEAASGQSINAVGSTGPFSPNQADVVVGVIDSLDPPATASVRHGEVASAIDFSPDALFWRDRAATLSDFSVGEEVVAEGAWDGDRFSASSLINLYREVAGQVTASEGGRLETTGGVIRITDSTARNEGESLVPVVVGDIHLGDQIDALGRIDPTTGDLVALRITLY